MFTRRYSVTLWVCVRSGVHVLASLDFKSGSLVVREGSSSVWLLPVSPAVVFQQLSGVNMCSITAHPTFFCYKQPKRPEWFTELILFPELHCSGLCGLTWDGCCSHPLRLIAFPYSLISESLPFFIYFWTSHLSLLTSIFLSIAIHWFLQPLSSSLYYVYVVCFPFPYLCYPLQDSPSYSFYLTKRWLHQCIFRRLHFITFYCHFATSLLFQKSITHQKSDKQWSFVLLCFYPTVQNYLKSHCDGKPKHRHH